MTQDAIDFTTWFFENIWYFFNSWKIPGTNTTPAAWLYVIVIVVVFLSWKVVKHIMKAGWL